MIIFFSVLLLILFLPIHVFVEFADELKIKIKILFFSFNVIKEKKDKTEKHKEKKESKNKPKKTIKERISFFLEVLNTASFVLKKLLKSVVVKKFFLNIKVQTEDAADTALQYGKICCVVYPFVSALDSFMNVKKKSINIFSNFESEDGAKTEINFLLDIYGSIWKLIYIVVSVIIYYIKRSFAHE